MNRKVVNSMLVGLSLMIGAQAMANTPPPPPANSSGGYEEITIVTVNGPNFPSQLVNRLHLTDNQRHDIHDIVDNAQIKLHDIVVKMDKNQKEIGKMLKNDYSEKDLAKIATEQGDLYTEHVTIKYTAKHDISQVLTSEQRDQVKLLQKARQHRRM